MTVDFCYSLMQFLVNKNQNGYLTPDDFNTIINQASFSFLDYLLGEFQQYQPLRQVSRVQFGNNETTRQRLTPLIYGYTLNIDSTGFAPYPGDYQQDDAMWTIYGFKRVKFTAQDKLASAYNSVIDPVATNPIYLIEIPGFRFYPNNLGQAKLSYVKTPPKIVWAYTLDVNGMPIYDPVNSVDPIWYDSDMLEIISRALNMVGINLQLNVVSQYANEITKQGQ